MKLEIADHALTKALELQAYLELEGRNPIETTSGSSAGVNHMANQFLTNNPAIFDDFDRSVKIDTDNMPHNRNRRPRDSPRSGKRDGNKSTDRRGQNDSQENRWSRYGNNTEVTRNIYMPSRNRQRNRNNSRQRYGQRYDSRDHRPEQQEWLVQFESLCNYKWQNRQNINFNSRNVQNRPQSRHQKRQHEFISNPRRRSYKNTTSSENQDCTHCKRTNHLFPDCKVCFNCSKIGRFRHECRTPRSSNLN